nr:PR domain zinc finger protein 8-like isoform X2 [Danio rerio]|eukprot:XP_001343474.4 PR domain zinc finger protein 8-like isoform X2 [Danio rerio]
MPWIKMGSEESARCLLDAAAAQRWITETLSSIRTARAVRAGAVLGPCAGAHSIAFIACKCSDRRAAACVLQIDPSESSEYLQMVQSARNSEEQNLEAYMKNGHLYFRAIKDIPEHTELLAWYGRDLAKLLGLSTERKNTTGFICFQCKQKFLFEFPLLAHQRFFCTEKPTNFLNTFTRPEIHPQSNKPTTDFHNLARELENCRKNKDTKNTKRRHSLESDSDESDSEPSSLDGDKKVSVKRFRLNGVNSHSWSSSSKTSFSGSSNSQFSPTKSHDNPTADPDSEDLRCNKRVTKSEFSSKKLPDVPDDLKSAFKQPPRITSHIPLLSASFPKNSTSVLPNILPLNFQSSTVLYKEIPKQLALIPSANLWPKTSRQPPTPPLQSLLPRPLSSSIGLPMQNWCAKCNISFHMTSDLVQHMRSHHKTALSVEKQNRRGDERLKCQICNEAFRERHHLSRHMTSHM